MASVLRSWRHFVAVTGFTAKQYSCSSSTRLLVTEPSYSWLRQLGLEVDNPGVFDGNWRAGSGPVSRGRIARAHCMGNGNTFFPGEHTILSLK